MLAVTVDVLVIYLSTLASPLPSCPSPPVISTLGGPVPSVLVILHRLWTHTAAIRCCCCRDALHSVFCKMPAILELTVRNSAQTMGSLDVSQKKALSHGQRPQTPIHAYAPPPKAQVSKIIGAERSIIGLLWYHIRSIIGTCIT